MQSLTKDCLYVNVLNEMIMILVQEVANTKLPHGWQIVVTVCSRGKSVHLWMFSWGVRNHSRAVRWPSRA